MPALSVSHAGDRFQKGNIRKNAIFIRGFVDLDIFPILVLSAADRERPQEAGNRDISRVDCNVSSGAYPPTEAKRPHRGRVRLWARTHEPIRIEGLSVVVNLVVV